VLARMSARAVMDLMRDVPQFSNAGSAGIAALNGEG
jgi:hypothetical protein